MKAVILIPMALFALFGSSRHLVVGADSATAAILAAYGALHYAAYWVLRVPPYHWYYTHQVVAAVRIQRDRAGVRVDDREPVVAGAQVDLGRQVLAFGDHAEGAVEQGGGRQDGAVLAVARAARQGLLRRLPVVARAGHPVLQVGTPLTVRAHAFSETAREKILAAGGLLNYTRERAG